MTSKARNLRSEHGAGLWRIAFALLGGLSVVSYLLSLWPLPAGSGDAWEWAFGIAAAVALILAALIAVRRRTMRLSTRMRLGTARGWLLFHTYGGTLFLLLMLMHTGFRMPNGPLMFGLWFLSVWTVATGGIGILLQRSIPRMLSSGLSIEVLYDRIPDLSTEIRERAAEVSQNTTEQVANLYAEKIAPELTHPRWRPFYFLDVTGGAASRGRRFDYVRRLLTADEAEALDTLEKLYRAKRELDAHYTLQGVLRGWLYLHVPTSFMLLALLVIHVFSVLYY